MTNQVQTAWDQSLRWAREACDPEHLIAGADDVYRAAGGDPDTLDPLERAKLAVSFGQLRAQAELQADVAAGCALITQAIQASR